MEAKTKKVATKKAPAASAAARGFDINERYSKKSDLEHVLLRPDTYVGGIDKADKEDWVVESNSAAAPINAVVEVLGEAEAEAEAEVEAEAKVEAEVK